MAPSTHEEDDVTIPEKATEGLTCRCLHVWRIFLTVDLLLFAAEFQFFVFQFSMGITPP